MRKLFIVGMLFISNLVNAGVIMETFTPDDSTYASGGWVLMGADSYLGVRFSLDSTTYLNFVTANLGGSGNFFTGIVSTESALPIIAPDFDSSGLLFYQENSFAGITSSDITTSADITLDAGNYVVFFGGLSDFGVSDFGWMPQAPDLTKSQISLSDYIEYRSYVDSWVEFPESGIRVSLEGQVVDVPLPPTLGLMMSGFLVLLFSLKKPTNRSL